MGADSTRRRAAAGFTLIELMIVLALAAIVLFKAGVVVSQASRTVQRDSSEMVLEDRARLVLDQIAYAVMGANRRALVPENTVFPLHTTDLRYQVSLGIEDGEVVWSDPELIELDQARSRVVWVDKPEMAGERRVVWSNLVRDLLEGEVVNGLDDNGNGLVDEEGLSFVIEDDHVTIRLSLARFGERGESTRTVETTVTCRNKFEAP
jgi:prepilin-type N-terminal cleavage/methylation domain-containing protein